MEHPPYNKCYTRHRCVDGIWIQEKTTIGKPQKNQNGG